jgi:hypothetical protein
LLALGLLAVGSMAWGSYHALKASADLERRLEEVLLVANRQNPYADPDATYPPPAMPAFTLALGIVAHWPAVARVGVLIANFVALGFVAHMLIGGRWPVWVAAAFALTAAASKPVRLTLGMGQFSLIPLAAMLAAEREADRGRHLRAGAWLAIALMKPTMSLPVLVLLAIRGQVKTVAAAAGLSLGSWLALAWWVQRSPMGLFEDWVGRARSQDVAGSIDLPSVLARISPDWAAYAPTVSLLVLAGVSVLLWRFGDRGGRAPATFAAFGAAVMTYHRPYDLVLLLPALAQEFDAGWRGTRRWRALTAVVLAALLIAPAKIPETVYDAVFIPFAYAFLALSVWRLADPQNDSTPQPA